MSNSVSVWVDGKRGNTIIHRPTNAARGDYAQQSRKAGPLATLQSHAVDRIGHLVNRPIYPNSDAIRAAAIQASKEKA